MAAPSAARDQAPWQKPALKCDIVMTGGITSGIVYPAAIVELAKRYSFKNVSGASAEQSRRRRPRQQRGAG